MIFPMLFFAQFDHYYGHIIGSSNILLTNLVRNIHILRTCLKIYNMSFNHIVFARDPPNGLFSNFRTILN